MEKYELDQIKSNLQNYLESNGINTNKLFKCLNPNHTDRNASMKYFNDNKVHCFGCGVTYNLIDVIAKIENLDNKTAFKRAIEYYEIKTISTAQKEKTAKNEEKSVKNGEKTAKNYEKAYKVWQKNFLNNETAKQYLKSRGIDEFTARRFNIGFNTFDFGKFKLNALVIPISKNCFAARNISSENSNIRYYKPTGCHTELFNKEALTNPLPFCAITEGEFDCLSFECVGINAMALSSVSNVNKFIEAQKDKNKKYILALDNDSAGKQATSELVNYFKENNINYIIFDNCGFKDANEALVSDKTSFINSVYSIIEQTENKKKKQAEM